MDSSSLHSFPSIQRQDPASDRYPIFFPSPSAGRLHPGVTTTFLGIEFYMVEQLVAFLILNLSALASTCFAWATHLQNAFSQCGSNFRATSVSTASFDARSSSFPFSGLLNVPGLTTSTSNTTFYKFSLSRMLIVCVNVIISATSFVCTTIHLQRPHAYLWLRHSGECAPRAARLRLTTRLCHSHGAITPHREATSHIPFESSIRLRLWFAMPPLVFDTVCNAWLAAHSALVLAVQCFETHVLSFQSSSISSTSRTSFSYSAVSSQRSGRTSRLRGGECNDTGLITGF
jgi:hypothetical protein